MTVDNEPVAGYKLLDWFVANGFVAEGDHMITRVVVDCPATGIVKVYVERLGTQRMLEVVPPALAPSQIREVDR